MLYILEKRKFESVTITIGETIPWKPVSGSDMWLNKKEIFPCLWSIFYYDGCERLFFNQDFLSALINLLDRREYIQAK